MGINPSFNPFSFSNTGNFGYGQRQGDFINTDAMILNLLGGFSGSPGNGGHVLGQLFGGPSVNTGGGSPQGVGPNNFLNPTGYPSNSGFGSSPNNQLAGRSYNFPPDLEQYLPELGGVGTGGFLNSLKTNPFYTNDRGQSLFASTSASTDAALARQGISNSNNNYKERLGPQFFADLDQRAEGGGTTTQNSTSTDKEEDTEPVKTSKENSDSDKTNSPTVKTSEKKSDSDKSAKTDGKLTLGSIGESIKGFFGG